MSALVELQRTGKTHWQPKGHAMMPIVKSLPYWRSSQGSYVHRVRSGTIYFHDRKPSHTALGLWCGMHGFIGRKGGLMAEPPPTATICATCEGRAIGAGQTESRMICGRVVKFAPRTIAA